MSVTRAVKSAVLAVAAGMVVHGETRRESLLGERLQTVGPAHEGSNVLQSAQPVSTSSSERERGREAYE